MVDNEKTRHVFPGRMCVFTELQMDPLTLHYVHFEHFKSALGEYHKLTKVLKQVKEVLVMKNVLVQEWTDRLTAALERRDKIWSVASALTKASFKVNRSVAGNLGYQIFH